MVNHGIGVDALNQVSFVPAAVVANNIVAISNTPGTANKTYHTVRDDYANMLDITGLITRLTGRQFEVFSVDDFVPELIRRCRYDNSAYQMARDASAWGISDPSLEDTVSGILKFMHRKGIISVAAREPSPVLSPCLDLALTDGSSATVFRRPASR
jgi:hypothetical protein